MGARAAGGSGRRQCRARLQGEQLPSQGELRQSSCRYQPGSPDFCGSAVEPRLRSPALSSLSQFSGLWYAIAKKDPEGLFLQDNIIAEFSVDEKGHMSATAKGRVRLLRSVASGGLGAAFQGASRLWMAGSPTLTGKGTSTLDEVKALSWLGSGFYWLLQQLGSVCRHGGHFHRHRRSCQVQDEVLGCSLLSPARK